MTANIRQHHQQLPQLQLQHAPSQSGPSSSSSVNSVGLQATTLGEGGGGQAGSSSMNGIAGGAVASSSNGGYNVSPTQSTPPTAPASVTSFPNGIQQQHHQQYQQRTQQPQASASMQQGQQQQPIDLMSSSASSSSHARPNSGTSSTGGQQQQQPYSQQQQTEMGQPTGTTARRRRIPGVSASEHRHLFHAYIYDYLYRHGYANSARAFLSEATDTPIKSHHPSSRPAAAPSSAAKGSTSTASSGVTSKKRKESGDGVSSKQMQDQTSPASRSDDSGHAQSSSEDVASSSRNALMVNGVVGSAAGDDDREEGTQGDESLDDEMELLINPNKTRGKRKEETGGGVTSGTQPSANGPNSAGSGSSSSNNEGRKQHEGLAEEGSEEAGQDHSMKSPPTSVESSNSALPGGGTAKQAGVEAFSQMPEPDVQISTDGGFLYEWWTVFWDVFRARGDRGGSPAARAFMDSVFKGITAKLELLSAPQTNSLHVQQAGALSSTISSLHPSNMHLDGAQVLLPSGAVQLQPGQPMLRHPPTATTSFPHQQIVYNQQGQAIIVSSGQQLTEYSGQPQPIRAASLNLRNPSPLMQGSPKPANQYQSQVQQQNATTLQPSQPQQQQQQSLQRVQQNHSATNSPAGQHQALASSPAGQSAAGLTPQAAVGTPGSQQIPANAGTPQQQVQQKQNQQTLGQQQTQQQQQAVRRAPTPQQAAAQQQQQQAAQGVSREEAASLHMQQQQQREAAARAHVAQLQANAQAQQQQFQQPGQQRQMAVPLQQTQIAGGGPQPQQQHQAGVGIGVPPGQPMHPGAGRRFATAGLPTAPPGHPAVQAQQANQMQVQGYRTLSAQGQPIQIQQQMQQQQINLPPHLRIAGQPNMQQNGQPPQGGPNNAGQYAYTIAPGGPQQQPQHLQQLQRAGSQGQHPSIYAGPATVLRGPNGQPLQMHQQPQLQHAQPGQSPAQIHAQALQINAAQRQRAPTLPGQGQENNAGSPAMQPMRAPSRSNAASPMIQHPGLQQQQPQQPGMQSPQKSAMTPQEEMTHQRNLMEKQRQGMQPGQQQQQHMQAMAMRQGVRQPGQPPVPMMVNGQPITAQRGSPYLPQQEGQQPSQALFAQPRQPGQPAQPPGQQQFQPNGTNDANFLATYNNGQGQPRQEGGQGAEGTGQQQQSQPQGQAPPPFDQMQELISRHPSYANKQPAANAQTQDSSMPPPPLPGVRRSTVNSQNGALPQRVPTPQQQQQGGLSSRAPTPAGTTPTGQTPANAMSPAADHQTPSGSTMTPGNAPHTPRTPNGQAVSAGAAAGQPKGRKRTAAEASAGNTSIGGNTPGSAGAGNSGGKEPKKARAGNAAAGKTASKAAANASNSGAAANSDKDVASQKLAKGVSNAGDIQVSEQSQQAVSAVPDGSQQFTDPTSAPMGETSSGTSQQGSVINVPTPQTADMLASLSAQQAQYHTGQQYSYQQPQLQYSQDGQAQQQVQPQQQNSDDLAVGDYAGYDFSSNNFGLVPASGTANGMGAGTTFDINDFFASQSGEDFSQYLNFE